MAREDKLMGFRDGEPIYGEYRIDYDSETDIRSDISGSGAVKSPSPGHPNHPVKDGYKRKLILGSQEMRDAAQDVLDDRGIDYTTESVQVTQGEKDAMSEYGATDGVQGADAVLWKDAMDSAQSVQEMKQVRRGTHPDTGQEFTPRDQG
jgi:hypothetical protein